jgi:hypothetical protein
MWANPQHQKPIEKIRKAQWTPENTAQTQIVVDRLDWVYGVLEGIGAETAAKDVRAAMERFRLLDGGVVLPERKP